MKKEKEPNAKDNSKNDFNKDQGSVVDQQTINPSASLPPKTNTFAIVSIILALFIPVVGIILAIIALTQINKSKESGRGLAVAGIVISVFVMLFQLVLFVGIVGAATSTKPTNTQQQDKIVTKIETKTEAIPFETKNIDDNSIKKGETKVDPEGKDGVKTITYEVTYTNDKETARKQTGEAVTTPPTTKVIHIGTYVAPAPTTSSGSTGQRVGAVCNDGTTSTATGSGACSHHGGVARWLYN